MSIFNEFDLIRVVNLPQRVDRRKEMDRELSGLGLGEDARVAFFDAIKPPEKGDFTSIGARGIYASQFALLREAASMGKSILILEDDCTFRSGASQYASSGEWDIFYGGYYASSSDDLQNSDIVGAHMMGFTAKAAKQIVAYLEDLTYQGVHPPIDAAYVWFRRANPDVRTEFAIPALAYQRSSRSDIAPAKLWDILPGVEVARKIRNRWRRY